MADVQQIQAYEARIRWGRLLDEVSGGASYIVSKRHQAVAALVPLEQWQRQDSGESAEARELAQLIEQFKARHAETMAQIDRAFAELAATRRAIKASRKEREAAQKQQEIDRAGA
jgi:antitoxin (DNA-binding transcriptional repressor) of toxin-antitoxin stability system